MTFIKRILAVVPAVAMAVGLCACTVTLNDASGSLSEEAPKEKNGDVMILFTSDVHCGVDRGFGYAGLAQIRDTYEKQGYTTILVDNGDSVQGETLGTVSKGESMIELMNALKYDVVIPGNHEFDYGMDRFLELTEMADFPYICCNFTYNGECVFEPYIIKEAAGMKIAFVGVTTPTTFTTSAPAYFMDENGKFVYGFCEDGTGQGVYDAVQHAVDDARANGADYVYVLGHIGMDEADAPWTYADIIENTNGIDVFLDGHSHDTEQVVAKNKDGEDVVRSACGTKLSCIGYSLISKDEGIVDTDILSWPNKLPAPEVLDINNEARGKVKSMLEEFEEQLSEKVATTDVLLTINDPAMKDEKGNPIRKVRRAETNMGDLCADAIRQGTGADIGMANGGGVRANIQKGDVTYKDIISVFPFDNKVSIVEVTGSQILDALEWGSRAVPNETGSFLQVSGLTYEIDSTIESGCKTDETGMCVGIEGKRRVSNVRVADEPIDPDGKYTLAGFDYFLIDNGDGYTAFDGATVIEKDIKLDNQILIDYIVEELDGNIGDEYGDPLGQGRIKIIE